MTTRQPIAPTVEIEPLDEDEGPYRFRLRSTRRGCLLEQRLAVTLDQALDLARHLILADPRNPDDVVISDPAQLLWTIFEPTEAAMADETASHIESAVALRLVRRWLREATAAEIATRLRALDSDSVDRFAYYLAEELGLLQQWRRRVAALPDRDR